MAEFVIDTVRKTVSGAVGAGRQAGGRAVATAGPWIVDAVDAVRTRLTGPHAVAPAPPVPTEVETPRPPQGNKPSTPTPASIAGNVAKHDPAADPVIPKPKPKPKPKPEKRPAPGAKLPTRKAT